MIFDTVSRRDEPTIEPPRSGAGESATGLLALLETAPDDRQVAIRGEHDPLFWRDLRRSVRRWRGACAGRPAGRYAIYLEDSLECLAALYAVWAGGGCAVLPADATPATCRYLDRHVDGLLGDFPVGFDPLYAGDTEAAPSQAAAHDRAALEVFTSGSTGTPVGIGKTLRQLDAETRVLEQRFGARVEGSQVIATVPHQHMYGLLFKLLWPLANGRVFRVEQAFFPEWVLAWLGKTRATLVTSPAFVKRMAAYQQWTAQRPDIALALSAGGALAPGEGKRAARLLGAPLGEIYGSTETGALAFRAGVRDDEAWHPLPGVRVDFTAAEPRFRAPHMPDPDRWYSFPDRVAARGDGFQLRGRADRIVKIEDRRVSLEEVERTLAAHAAVAECRVVVLPRRKTVLGAVIVAVAPDAASDDRGAQRTLRRELLALARASLAPIAVPRSFRIVRQLPGDAMGKVTSARLRALFDA